MYVSKAKLLGVSAFLLVLLVIFISKDKFLVSDKNVQIEAIEKVKNEAVENFKDSGLDIKGAKVESNSAESELKPTGIPIPTNTPLPTDTPIPTYAIPTTVSTEKPDDTQKLEAISNLVRQMITPNKTIILANMEINRLLSELKACDPYPNSCRDTIETYVNKYSDMRGAAYQEISSISRQIQNIISTCKTSVCNESYQGVVSEFETNGYVAR